MTLRETERLEWIADRCILTIGVQTISRLKVGRESSERLHLGLLMRRLLSLTVSELSGNFIGRNFQLSEGQKYLLGLAARSFSDWWLGRKAEGRRQKAVKPATLRELTDENFCSWLSWRCKSAALATVKRERKDLLQLWRWAAARKWCRGPSEVPVIKLPKRLPKAMELDKLALCIQICEQLPGLVRGTKIPRSVFYPALLAFIYDTASRIGAAMAVRRDEVSWEHCSVSLAADPAKTDCEQIVYFTDRTRGLLRRLTRFSPESEMLFPFPLSRSTLHWTFRTVRAKAGLPKRREGFHRIRATHATIVTARLGIETAAHQLGHTTTQVTWDRYVDRAMLAEFLSSARAVDVLPALPMSGPAEATQLRLF